MKKLHQSIMFFLAMMLLVFVATSCEDNQDLQKQEDILPKTFSVEIPKSLSNDNAFSGGRIRNHGRSQTDTLNGNDIYKHLQTFIAVGEGASELVEEFVNGIRFYKIDRVMSLTYVSDDDNRTKNLVVSASPVFENRSWDYQLTITDADSESSSDGGKALQIFWNKRNKVEGIAIIKPYNCDRAKNAAAKDAIFRIDYEELPASGYDAEMTVSIAGLPLPSPLQEPFAMNNLKMFVGKKGNVVDVSGNSSHPNAYLFTDETGFNWAFVAAGDEVKDIGVAKVGLPPSSVDSDDATVLLDEYSIKNVFTTGITNVWPWINQQDLANYLKNTEGPGYFGSRGFLAGGTSPGADWDVLATRLSSLKPYKPTDIDALTLSFK